MSGIDGSLDPILSELGSIAEPSQYTTASVGEVRSFYQSTTAAGTTPKGDRWEPRQSDGGKPLNNAFKAIDVRQVDPTTIVVELSGHHVFPHYGAKGHPVRTIIDKDIENEKLGNAIARGVVKPWKERA